MHVSDVQSLYPERGISDAIIDFFSGCMVTEVENGAVVRALGYTAISSQSSTSKFRTKVKILEHKWKFKVL